MQAQAQREGDEISVSVEVKNTGDIDAYIRAAVVLKEGKIRVLPPAPKKKGKK